MDIELFRRANANEMQTRKNLLEAAAGPGVVSGKFMVNNTGEATKSVSFPVKFSQIPSISFGFELLDTVNIISGLAPEISAQISDWNVEERPPVSRFYIGATIRVVSTGPSFSKFIVHWTASGITFTNPV